MLFIKLSPRQAAAYSYTCSRLQTALDKMINARKTLEQLARSSFDKSFAKCVYLFASESIQFEHEINAQINSLSYTQLNEEEQIVKPEADNVSAMKNIESLCNYLEENYIQSYKQLLEDKRLSRSLKSLMNNHLQMFLSNLTQLHLLNDVQTFVN